MASSYAGDFALIEPARVIVVFASGYEIRDAGYRLIRDPELPRDDLREALQEVSRFYREPRPWADGDGR